MGLRFVGIMHNTMKQIANKYGHAEPFLHVSWNFVMFGPGLTGDVTTLFKDFNYGLKIWRDDA